MSIYLNTDNQAFCRILRDGYVDKSASLSFFNSKLFAESGFICVSRPRRFGKSINAKMLNAYYSKGANSKDIFDKLNIAKDPSYLENLNKYNVIYLDMQSFKDEPSLNKTYLDDINESVVNELKEAFSSVLKDTDINLLPDAILKIYQETKEQFIFIIDEWDYVFRTFPTNQVLQAGYIDLLRQLFKSEPNSQSVILAYITGILPIKKYKTESALNNFDEYTMLNPMELASSLGFTKTEVKALCDKNGVDFYKTCDWYDGYRLGSEDIFNPKSIMMLMRTHEFESYWTQTGSFDTVSNYINMNFEGLKDDIISLVNGNSLTDIDVSDFSNDLTSFHNKNSVIIYLIHLGYLAYSKENNKKLVYIPNEELRQELIRSVNNSQWNEYIQAIDNSKQLLAKTVFEKDPYYVAKAIEREHQKLSSIISYNLENDLCITVNNAYTAASAYYFKPKRELPLGKGFADIVYIPKPEYSDVYPALVIELKWDHKVKTAIDQIKRQEYCKSLEEYTGNILMVGISYEKDSKKHTCLIEEYSK